MNTARPSLALARTLAWALRIGGWLVLGALGRQHLPLWVGGLLPVAVWLAAMGAWRVLAAGRAIPIVALRAVIVVAGAVAAVALARLAAGDGAAALLLAALAWGGLLVAVSHGVRALRRDVRPSPPLPYAPAAMGAALAWWVAGDALALRDYPSGAAWAVLLAAGIVAALLPRRAPAVSACRAGLFDCSLQLPVASAWLRPAEWPLQAAGWAMLPMMASWAAMADWCGALGDSVPLPAQAALHLAAMLLPAWACGPLLRLAPRALLDTLVTVALLAGAAAGLLLPGLDGGMAAALAQAVAWSLAWGAALAAPSRGNVNGTAGRAAASLSRWQLASGSAAACVALLALGSAIATTGPAALQAVHLALAGLAAVGWLCGRPATLQVHG